MQVIAKFEEDCRAHPTPTPFLKDRIMRSNHLLESQSQFSGHTVSNNSVDVPKVNVGFGTIIILYFFTSPVNLSINFYSSYWKLSDLQRIAVGAEELLSGNTIPLCAPGNSFDGSTAQIFQNETVAPTRYIIDYPFSSIILS